MSLALLEKSGVDVVKLSSSSPKSSMEYLTLIRDTNELKGQDTPGSAPQDIDLLAMNYLTIPRFKGTDLMTALLLKEGISGKLVKILSNVIPKEMVATILNISMTNLSHQYRRKALDKSQTESIVAFLNIWNELMSLFQGRNDVVIEWLSNEKSPLCDNKPINLMDTASGREAVKDLIYRIKTGDLS